MDDRSTKGIMVGYGSNATIYRLYSPIEHSVVIS